MKANTYKQDERPSLQFYPDDWMSEPSLQLCSLAARGLWFEMLMLMFKSTVRGTLKYNNLPIEDHQLAVLVRASHDEVKVLLDELEQNRVFSRLDDKTIYCRRMYKTWVTNRDKTEKRIRAGILGAAARWGQEAQILSGEGNDSREEGVGQ